MSMESPRYIYKNDKNPSIKVALSGGGHRASLFSLGVLLALVDLGLNKRVTQIASVSGGTITNAFIAYNCQFEDETPKTFDSMAKKLFDIIVTRGILTKFWMLVYIVLLIVPPIVIVIVFFFGPIKNIIFGFSFAGLWITIIMLRGLILEFVITRRFFTESSKKSRLKDLKSQKSISKEVDHVFCCTDLLTGKPFYISSHAGGSVLYWYSTNDDYLREKWLKIPNLPMRAVIRASANFPGIPPRRLRLRKFIAKEDEVNKTSKSVKTVFLSDGGVYNNLGTQTSLEDYFYKSRSHPDIEMEESVLIVANASAEVRADHWWTYYIPGWAEFKALIRNAEINNSNSVLPRTKFLKFLSSSMFYDKNSSGIYKIWPVIVELYDREDDWSKVLYSDEMLKNTGAIRRWKNSFTEKILNWYYRFKDDQSPNYDKLYSLVANEVNRKEQLEKQRSMKDVERFSYSHLNYKVKELIAFFKGNLKTVPTTLDKITNPTALSLLAKGYFGTISELEKLQIIKTCEDNLSQFNMERFKKLFSGS